jgi:hypothetical protein
MRSCGLAPTGLEPSVGAHSRNVDAKPDGTSHWASVGPCHADTRYENRFLARPPFLLSSQSRTWPQQCESGSTQMQMGKTYPYTVQVGKPTRRLRVTTGPVVSLTTENETTIHFEDRLSDSPFVERVWRCHSACRRVSLHCGESCLTLQSEPAE